MKRIVLCLLCFVGVAQAMRAQTLLERYKAMITLKPEEGVSFTADTTTRLANAAVPAVNLTASGFVLMGSGASGSRTQAITPDGKTYTTLSSVSGIHSFADGSTIYLPDGRMRYLGQETSPTHTKEKPRQRIASWISNDGITWSKESGVRFQPGALDDSIAGVPYIFHLKDSTWRLYYVGDLFGNAGKTTGKAWNGVRTAISTDWGMTFTAERTTNLARDGDVDPHVVYLTNGKYRMYLKAAKSQGATIYVESSDGLTFDTTKITTVIASNAGGVAGRYDPFVVKFPDGRVVCFHGTDDGVQGGRQKVIADVGVVLTAVTQEEQDYALNIIPNPAFDGITIEWFMKTSGFVRITLLDVLGNEVQRLNDGVYARGEQVYTASTKGLAQGLYYIRLQTASASFMYPLHIIR